MSVNNLAVYLSNRCNLSCSYCYVAVNQGKAEYLDVEVLKRAIDYFLSLPQPAGAEPKISFLGGEPLLKFEELKKVLLHARKSGGKSLIIHLFTNGTLLDKEKLDFLLRHGTEVTLSLDGRKESNDRYRRFYGDPSKSVYEETMRRLKNLPKDRLGVNLVFTQETVGALLGNIHFFYEQGFQKISFTPDLYDLWSEERLGDLRLVMERFSRYYRTLVESGARLFSIANLYAALEKTKPAPQGRIYWWQDCHNLVLGADGRFYSCDKPLGFPFNKIKNYQVGCVESGVDWVAREQSFRRAAAFIDENATGGQKDFFSCPMGVYFTNEIKGANPRAAVSNFQTVSGIYSRALLDLFESLKHNPRFLEVHNLKHADYRA